MLLKVVVPAATVPAATVPAATVPAVIITSGPSGIQGNTSITKTSK